MLNKEKNQKPDTGETTGYWPDTGRIRGRRSNNQVQIFAIESCNTAIIMLIFTNVTNMRQN